MDELQLLVATARRPGRNPDTAWFAETDKRQRGHSIANLLEAVDRRLDVLSRDAGRRAADQRAEAERRRHEASQRLLATLAAVLLGPSVVAAGLGAFPDWLPNHQRDDAMLGLSIAAAGAIWLVVELVSQRSGRWYGSVIAGGVALAVGTVVAWPINEGSDRHSPELSITCPF